MRHPVHLVHHSHGRVRLRVPSAKGNPQAMEEMRRLVSSIPGVETVSTNDSIGTMTVHYDPRRKKELQLMLAATAAGTKALPPVSPGLKDLAHVDSLLEKEAEFLASHSHTATALMDAVKSLDQEIKRATGNAVDLKVIGPLALAVAVFMELGIAAATPVWLTLGLFSVNHFIELHTPNSDSSEAPSDGESPNPVRQARSRRKNPRFP